MLKYSLHRDDIPSHKNDISIQHFPDLMNNAHNGI